jgi:hypothetical protein
MAQHDAAAQDEGPVIKIETVPARQQIEITVTDLLDPAEIEPFINEYRRILAGSAWHSSSYNILIDASRAAVQPREIADAFGQLARSSHKKARRVAIVLSSRLLALQAKRVFENRGETLVFYSAADALRWLGS